MPYWKRTLGILATAQFINFAAFTMLVPVLPLYVVELGVTDPARAQIWVGVVVAANWITAAIGSPIWGALADRVGKKPMILRAAFGLSAVVALLTFVQSVEQLLAVRLLQGTMVGFGTAATALVTSQAPRREVGYAAGLMQTAQVAGTVIGPLLGGTLVHLMGSIRPIFLVIAAAVSLTGVLTLVMVREERTAAAPRSNPAGESAMALLRGNPSLRAMLLIIFVTLFATQTVDPTLPLYIGSLGIGAASLPLVAGLVLSSPGVTNVLAAPSLGRLGDRIGSHHVLTLSLVAAAVSFGLQGLADGPISLIGARLMLGVCLGGLLPAVSATISRSLPIEAQGRGFGLAMSATFLGQVFGPITGGVLSAWVGGWSVFPAAALLLMAVGVWRWYIAKRGDRSPVIR